MKKVSFSALFLLIAGVTLFAQEASEKIELPELNIVNTVTLSPSYSCRENEASPVGYENTSLFLTDYARKKLGPDLVFNGACKSEDFFEAATSGDDFSLIADLGMNVTFEDISAAKAFNVKRVHMFDEYSKFARAAPVLRNHTYAVLLNGADRRGLFIFTVIEYVPNQRVVLKYAVKSYQAIPGRRVRSEGFGWDTTSK